MKPLHIHIHRPTRDAGWEESKHPRADNGKFGSGGKSEAPHGQSMTPAQRQARIKLLEGQYARLSSEAPLRTKAALMDEIKALKAIK